MYCESRDEYVDYDECCECSDRYGCEDKVTKREITTQDTEKIDNSVLAKAMQERLSSLLGLQPKEIDMMSINIVDVAQKRMISEIKECIGNMVSAKVNEFIKESAGKYLNELFRDAVSEQILQWDKNDKAVKTTIQTVVVNKITAFLATKDRNSRSVIQQTVDRAIEVKVNEMVSSAIDEIKSETIDKFQKEIMKKMMQGMVKEIASDKRIMAAIDI